MKNRGTRVLQVVICVAAVLCICTGLVRDEHLIVLQKAVNICLECIGLG